MEGRFFDRFTFLPPRYDDGDEHHHQKHGDDCSCHSLSAIGVSDDHGLLAFSAAPGTVAIRADAGIRCSLPLMPECWLWVPDGNRRFAVITSCCGLYYISPGMSGSGSLTGKSGFSGGSIGWERAKELGRQEPASRIAGSTSLKSCVSDADDWR